MHEVETIDPRQPGPHGRQHIHAIGFACYVGHGITPNEFGSSLWLLRPVRLAYSLRLAMDPCGDHEEMWGGCQTAVNDVSSFDPAMAIGK